MLVINLRKGENWNVTYGLKLLFSINWNYYILFL